MRISHKHKFAFIATPKTASSTIRNCLNEYTDIKGVENHASPYYWHTTAFDLKKHFNEKKWNWDEYFTFSFVRNPWDLMVSKYEYRNLKSRDNTKFGRESEGLLKQIKNFEDFVRKDHSGFLGHHWCFDANGKQIVDFIGKFENLQEDFDIVCDKIGIPQQQLPHKNKTNHKHYTEYYDDETRQIVAEKYAKDIEMFDYEFGE